jgi:hypothetical protein
VALRPQVPHPCPRHIWNDNIKMNLEEMYLMVLTTLVSLTQDRIHWQAVMDVIKKLWVRFHKGQEIF